MTQWCDSDSAFTPTVIQGSRGGAYHTTARATCSICGAVFAYKDPVPQYQTKGFVIGAVASALVFMICLHISVLLAGLAFCAVAAFILLAMMTIAKPLEPYFKQISGPTHFQHRVKRLR